MMQDRALTDFPVESLPSKSPYVEFLITDLDVALTFVHIAEVSTIPETVTRNHNNARIAYDTVLRFRPMVEPNIRPWQQINEKMRELKSLLEAVGQRY